MQLDFSIISNAAVNLTCELFNSLNSFTHSHNVKYIVPGFNYVPYPVYTGIVAQVPTGIVTFQNAGAVVVKDNAGTDTGIFINCNTYPYRSLLKAMEPLKIKINRIKITCVNTPQLTQVITRFEQIPLTTDVRTIDYTPKIDPMNVQNFIIELKEVFEIDGNSGIRFQVLPGSEISMSIYFDIVK